MPIRYEWADDQQLILNIYIEFPWTWTEYNATIDEVMPMLRDLGHPCATVVNTEEMKSLPKDGNVVQILMNVEKKMPENIFASGIVGPSQAIRVFMNVLMKMRPRAQRTAFFAESMEDAYSRIHERYHELYTNRGES